MFTESNIVRINEFDKLNRVFTEETPFLKKIHTPRVYGGNNIIEQIVFTNVRIEIPIIIGRNYPLDQPTIAKVRSQENYSQNSDFPHLVFEGGEFNELHFYKFQLGIEERFAPSMPLQVEIRGGEFFGPVLFSNSYLNSVKITGGIFHSEVQFGRGIYNNIVIRGGEFRKGIRFGMNPVTSDVKFRPKIPISSDIPAWKSNENGIYDTIEILDGTLNDKIVFDACLVKGHIRINSNSLMSFDMINLIVNKSIEIQSGVCSILRCKSDNISFKGISESSDITVSVINSEMNLVSFEGRIGKNSLIDFQNTSTNKCEFINLINRGGITFNGIFFAEIIRNYSAFEIDSSHQRFSKEDFQYNYSLMKLRGSEYLDKFKESYRDVIDTESSKGQTDDFFGLKTTTPSIKFLNSDIGKSSFIGSDLTHCFLYFENSKLTEIFLAGTYLPDFKSINPNNGSNLEQKRLALSQLKKVYELQGDMVTSSEYRAEELETYRLILKNKGDCKYFFEQLQLRVNGLSNKHGRSWERALLLLFIFGTISWYFLCQSVGFHFVELNTTSLNTFIDSAQHFIQFLLPIHEIDLLENFVEEVVYKNSNSESLEYWKQNFLPVFKLMDTVWRLVSTYLVYQLIAAFRKHNIAVD